MNSLDQLTQVGGKQEDFVIPKIEFSPPTIWALTAQLGQIRAFSLPESKYKFEKPKTTIYLEPQDEGGFVARSAEYEGAVGQGETEEEAIKDLNDAIETLKDFFEGKLSEEY